MPQIRIVKVVFDTIIQDFEIPSFRGAVIEIVGRSHVIFHNHLSDDKLHYKYPAIQYKREGNHASILCIKEGVEEIHHFFINNIGLVRIGNKHTALMVKNVSIQTCNFHVSDEFFTYQIKRWLPLHGENYEKYSGLDGLVDQIAFLERVMVGNILSMAKGLEWFIEEAVSVKITSINNSNWTYLKKKKVLSFDLIFKTNVFLPYGIGLGKSSSIGFGTIEKATIKKLAI
ncbi:hypothetical protein MM239_18660 [Belliella sp. DSM 111904]|uniref:Uncharacterized protein n=1 Tax=Belliella filtrata TaxID=2923435 RepID=A0ABS9V4W7_9BACT|nr:CRISPR-associated endonuclease Cas6 [Belliella filtrata]MCH7411418.1 hypothetical protein [Belliella filtrata]